MDIKEMLARWESDEGKPYKRTVIDMEAYKADPGNIGCMCAQGQVLHLLGGWSAERLFDAEQDEVDHATAKVLNISRIHAVLLRLINDTQEGAPAIVVTHPERVLGKHTKQVLAFWLALDGLPSDQLVSAKIAQATDVFREINGSIVRFAAVDAVGDRARREAATAAWDFALETNEIQGQAILRERGQTFHFLPLFGFNSPDEIPPLPAGYGPKLT